MDYQRSDLPVWVQGWLEVQKPALVFIAQKSEKGPYLVDGNSAARKAFQRWTGSHIPILEQIEEHKKADLEAWKALASKDLNKLSSLVFYQEEIEGQLYETIKTPISEDFIVILTHPVDKK